MCKYTGTVSINNSSIIAHLASIDRIRLNNIGGEKKTKLLSAKKNIILENEKFYTCICDMNIFILKLYFRKRVCISIHFPGGSFIKARAGT